MWFYIRVFCGNKVEFFHDSNLVGSDVLSNGLYLLNLDFIFVVQCQAYIYGTFIDDFSRYG